MYNKNVEIPLLNLRIKFCWTKPLHRQIIRFIQFYGYLIWVSVLIVVILDANF